MERDTVLLLVVVAVGGLLAWYLLGSDTAVPTTGPTTTKGCAPVNVKGVPICTNLESYKATGSAIGEVGTSVAAKPAGYAAQGLAAVGIGGGGDPSVWGKIKATGFGQPKVKV